MQTIDDSKLNAIRQEYHMLYSKTEILCSNLRGLEMELVNLKVIINTDSSNRHAMTRYRAVMSDVEVLNRRIRSNQVRLATLEKRANEEMARLQSKMVNNHNKMLMQYNKASMRGFR